MKTDGLINSSLSGSIVCEVPSELYDALHDAYINRTEIGGPHIHPVFNFPYYFVVIDERSEVLPNMVVAYFELTDIS